MNERQLIFKDEVYQIVGAALEGSNNLSCGFLEAIYQEAPGRDLDSMSTFIQGQPAFL